MNVGAEPGVVGQIPAVVVRIFVDDDGITVPQPTIREIVIVGRDAEVETPEPEAFAVSSAKMEHMTPARAAGEVAAFPGMIDVIVGVVAAGIVAHPLIVVVHVGRLRAARFIPERASVFLCMAFGVIFSCMIFGCAGLRHVRGVVRGGWAVRGHVSSANVASRAQLLPFVLRTGGVGQQVPRNAKSEQNE